MTIEAYVQWAHSFPQTCSNVLAPFFPQCDLTTVRVVVIPSWIHRFTRLVGFHAVLVLGTTIYCCPGVLDAHGMVAGNFWSWTAPRGIALWAHEVKHVEQYQSHPWRFWSQIGRGILRSWCHGAWYTHQYFPYEVEAIAFQNQVRQHLEEAAAL